MERNNEFIKRWIKWLRETDFDQGNSSLRGVDGFCCLGIACHKSTKIRQADNISGATVYEYKETEDSDELYLPDGFREWVGLTLDEEVELAWMNDQNKSFSEIADWIEENVYKQEPDFFLTEN